MRRFVGLVCLAGSVTVSGAARGEVLFHGDFETGDLEQWSNLLKPEGLSVVMDPVAEGTHAGKVSITKNELWPNGLNRVEVQYLPEEQYTSEGADIYYGYSFYLPEELTQDGHSIFYWETNAKNTGNYQQMLVVDVSGTHMSFATQKPNYKVHWQQDGLATAQVWHRLAIHIKFANDAQVGSIDLWFDGKQVVTGAKAQTYIGDPTFTQHGILRDTIDKVEVLYMDDAKCGTTLEDVMPTAMGGGGMGGASSGGAAGSVNGGAGGGATDGGAGAAAVHGGNATGGAPSVPAGASNGGTGQLMSGLTPSAEESGCGCRSASLPQSRWASFATLLGLVTLTRRRRARC